MEPGVLLGRVRGRAGLTQEELAHRAGTSRPTLSAYEHGRKSPTVATFARLLAEAGWELAAEPHVSFTQHLVRGRPIWVPGRLPRLDAASALAAVNLPVHLNWSGPGSGVQHGVACGPCVGIRGRLAGGAACGHPRLRRWRAARRPVG